MCQGVHMWPLGPRDKDTTTWEQAWADPLWPQSRPELATPLTQVEDVNSESESSGFKSQRWAETFSIYSFR